MPGLRGALAQFLRPDLPGELELPQIAKQGALFDRQAISFVMQRLEAVGGAGRERLGSRAIRQLSPEKCSGQQNEHNEQNCRGGFHRVFCGRKL